MAKLALALFFFCCVMHAMSAPSPTKAIDCSNALVNLADCLTFVEEGSKEMKPQGQCCHGLKKVVKEEVSCLCEAFKGSADYGVKLNMSKALTLPSACGVKTPPFSKCNIGVGTTGVAPALSPATAPSASPTIGQSVAIAPAPGPMISAAVSFPAPLVLFLFAIASALFSCYL